MIETPRRRGSLYICRHRGREPLPGRLVIRTAALPLGRLGGFAPRGVAAASLLSRSAGEKRSPWGRSSDIRFGRAHAGFRVVTSVSSSATTRLSELRGPSSPVGEQLPRWATIRSHWRSFAGFGREASALRPLPPFPDARPVLLSVGIGYQGRPRDLWVPISSGDRESGRIRAPREDRDSLGLC